MAIETELQAQVDAQLMEQGSFAPLELLFNSGRLMYSDYEAWRRREIELLDEVLMGDRAKVLTELERAAGYARGIGLVEQPQELIAWDHANPAGAPSNKPLRASAEPKLHRLVCSRYLPAQDAPQMDLFFDNPVVALTNGIARALCSRNLAESRRLLDRLYVQAPTHADLATLDRLVAGLDDLGRPVADPAERLAFINAVTPAARQLLGPGARDYLSPLWRHLADALVERSFSPAEPDLHRSFALGQAQDWIGVTECILRESRWWNHPALCARLVDSCLRRRRRVEALTAWCHLCWLGPEGAGEAVERLKQPDLTALWLQFLDCSDEVWAGEGSRADAGGRTTPALELSPRDFPAWLLLHEPGLARQLSADLPPGHSPAEEHYRVVHRWVHAHRAHRQPEEMALRRSLQQSHPVLFEVLKRSLRREAV